MRKPPFKRNPYLREKIGLTDFSLKSRFYCISSHLIWPFETLEQYLVWVVVGCLCHPPVLLRLEVSRSRKACGPHTCPSNTWDWSNPRRSATHVSPKPPQLEAWIFWTSSGHKGLWGRHLPPPFVVTISLWWLIRCQHGSAAASGRWVGLATQHCKWPIFNVSPNIVNRLQWLTIIEPTWQISLESVWRERWAVAPANTWMAQRWQTRSHT